MYTSHLQHSQSRNDGCARNAQRNAEQRNATQRNATQHNATHAHGPTILLILSRLFLNLLHSSSFGGCTVELLLQILFQSTFENNNTTTTTTAKFMCGALDIVHVPHTQPTRPPPFYCFLFYSSEISVE